MKNIIIHTIVALALVFGACSKDLPDHQAEDELDKDLSGQVEEELIWDITRLNNSECEYTVYSDGLAAIVIDGRLVYVTQFKLIDDYGNTVHAYCANMESPCYEGARYHCASADDYFKDDAETKIIAALTYIMNQYGWMETANPHGFRQMVQSIIWRIIHGYEVTYVDNQDGAIIKDVINHIYDDIDDILIDYRSGVTMEGENTATKDGLFVNYGPYYVSENVLLFEVDFHLTFDRNDVNAKFINETGLKITQVKPQEPFYLRVSGDVSGDITFTATASTTEKLWYVNDFQFFIDVREGDYQQLFRPIMSQEASIYYYSCDGYLTITSTEPEPEPEPEPKPEIEMITLTNLSWNNGNNGGINSFTVNGIKLKNGKNYVPPASFNALIAKTPGKNDETAIYTVTERTVSQNNGKYLKVYDVKVALYAGGIWKGYSGTISVDNPGGNNANQQVDLKRYF